MKSSQIVFVTIAMLLGAGCVSRYALFEHPETKQQKFCVNKGWGWIGAPVAISDHNECLDQLQKQGYRKISDEPPNKTDLYKSNTSSETKLSPQVLGAEHPSFQNQTVPSIVTSKDGDFRVSLPDGWVQSPLPQPLQKVNAQIYAENLFIDSRLLITTDNKSDIQDFQAYAESIKTSLAAGLSSTRSSEMQRMKINGYDSIRFDISGVTQGVKIHYLMTVLQADTKVIKLNVWTVESRFSDNRSDFEQLASGLQF